MFIFPYTLQYDKSQEYYEKARAIDPKQTEKYSYLGQVSSEKTRSAVAFDGRKDILFAGDDA